ncbi:hypothetical protein ACGFIY_19700 [Micromonospora chersina]|uniref:hypothetical protein n=1 Tax=Micromonospora chersina TaxID=47854 RepID=UPI003714467A
MAAELCAAAGVPTLTRHEVSRWERQRRLPGDFWSGWLAVVLGVPDHLLAEAAACSRQLAQRGPGGAGGPAHPPPAGRAPARAQPVRPGHRHAGPAGRCPRSGSGRPALR